jgi:hypothetical protein
MPPLRGPVTRQPRPARLGAAVVTTLALAAGCSGGEDAAAADRRVAPRETVTRTDSLARGLAIVSRVKYQVAASAASGGVDGVVRLEGTAPPDSAFAVEHDAARCGATITVRPVSGNAGALADAVVWLDDVRSGKRLPETRRVELTHERCRYEPRVQAAAAPNTLNVLNDDRAIHLTTITRVGAEKPLAAIPFNDNGQVVPSEIAGRESGIVELRCREHPWAVAYLASFDHPYYAVTGADGRFRLDSVPPGRYVLKVWHPRAAQVVSQTVEIGAAASSVELRVPVK